jgi:hypothetical protein
MGLPAWYLFLQILFPAAIGIGGGAIAWAQWRTANQKVVLDLFDRRFRIYNAARVLNRSVIGAGAATTEQMVAMAELAREAKFLFGPEVAAALAEASDAMLQIEVAEKELKGLPVGQVRSATVRKSREGFNAVKRIQMSLPVLFLPYMKMDTKVIRSPREWLGDANKRRLAEHD